MFCSFFYSISHHHFLLILKLTTHYSVLLCYLSNKSLESRFHPIEDTYYYFCPFHFGQRLSEETLLPEQKLSVRAKSHPIKQKSYLDIEPYSDTRPLFTPSYNFFSPLFGQGIVGYKSQHMWQDLHQIKLSQHESYRSYKIPKV